MSTSCRMPRWAPACGSAALAQPGAVLVWPGLAAAAATWARNPITVHAVPGCALPAGGELDAMPAEVSDLRPGVGLARGPGPAADLLQGHSPAAPRAAALPAPDADRRLSAALHASPRRLCADALLLRATGMRIDLPTTASLTYIGARRRPTLTLAFRRGYAGPSLYRL